MNVIVLHVVGRRNNPESDWFRSKYPWVLAMSFRARPARSSFIQSEGAQSIVNLSGEPVEFAVAETVEEIAQLCDARQIHREPGESDKKT